LPGSPRRGDLLLIENAKLNGLNPQHYVADALARIAELLPWNWEPSTPPAPPPERLP
jgi:hypothetical protein